MKIKDGQTILFIGDSITDCGRREADAPLGNGYVKLFVNMLIIRHPRKSITTINEGISGDVVTGLRDRWADNVIRNNPNWLAIKIGINDLHRTLEQRPEPVPPQLYREAYEDIIKRTIGALPKCQLLLIDPFYISNENSASSFQSAVLKLLPEYLQIVHILSRKYGTLLVKTHEVFHRLLETHEADTFCPEPVHPNLTGHMVIAEEVYNVLDSKG